MAFRWISKVYLAYAVIYTGTTSLRNNLGKVNLLVSKTAGNFEILFGAFLIKFAEESNFSTRLKSKNVT